MKRLARGLVIGINNALVEFKNKAQTLCYVFGMLPLSGRHT
jgi:hypothetical protein